MGTLYSAVESRSNSEQPLLHVVDHPLLQAKLTRMRDETTPSAEFRRLLHEITLILAVEATRDLSITSAEVQTPLERGTFPVLKDTNITIAPILRAGLAMVEGFTTLIPFAHIGHIGLERDEVTKLPKEYYYKMPPDLATSTVIVVDPMLATGGSATDALSALKRHGATNIRLVNILAAPRGIETVQKAHPDVPLYIGSVDRELNEAAYILPGLGDAGDRCFNTLAR